MQTKEIQQSDWREFFDNFSRTYQGSAVGIEILGLEIGAQTEETGLALEGITAESDEKSDDTIVIMVGANADDHITHSVRRPTQVSLEQTDEGLDLALAIKGADGCTVLLRFQSSVLTEQFDAVAG
jgi:hypothetical protein